MQVIVVKRGLEHHRDESMDLEAVEEMGRQQTEVQKGCRKECVQGFLGVSKVDSFVRDTMACREHLGPGRGLASAVRFSFSTTGTWKAAAVDELGIRGMELNEMEVS